MKLLTRERFKNIIPVCIGDTVSVSYKRLDGEVVLAKHEVTNNSIIDTAEIHELKDEQGFKNGYACLIGQMEINDET